MGGTARIEYPVPAVSAGPVTPAQSARNWLTGPEVQALVAGLQDPVNGMPDHALTRFVTVTVDWA